MKNFWDEGVAKFKALPQKQRQYWMIGGAAVVAFAIFGSGGEQAGTPYQQGSSSGGYTEQAGPPGGPIEQPQQGATQPPYQPQTGVGPETPEQFEKRMAEQGYQNAEVSDAITGAAQTVCYNPTTETMITLPSSYSCPAGTVAQ